MSLLQGIEVAQWKTSRRANQSHQAFAQGAGNNLAEFFRHVVGFDGGAGVEGVAFELSLAKWGLPRLECFRARRSVELESEVARDAILEGKRQRQSLQVIAHRFRTRELA